MYGTETIAQSELFVTVVAWNTRSYYRLYFVAYVHCLKTVVYRDIQVQLRFCLLETSCEQQDKFPSGIGVRINSRPAQLPVRSCCLWLISLIDCIPWYAFDRSFWGYSSCYYVWCCISGIVVLEYSVGILLLVRPVMLVNPHVRQTKLASSLVKFLMENNILIYWDVDGTAVILRIWWFLTVGFCNTWAIWLCSTAFSWLFGCSADVGDL